MHLIAINNGSHSTKIKTSTTVDTFYSLYREPSGDDGEIVFEVDGEKYVVGELGEGDFDLKGDKTTNKSQLISILYGAVKNLPKVDHLEIAMITAQPVNEYLNIEARKEYKQFLETTRKTVRFDGRPVVVDIMKCHVFMEGAAAVAKNLAYFLNKEVVILDIGGRTINYGLFRNGKLVHNTGFSKNKGVLVLESDIAKRVNIEKRTDLKPYQMEHIFSNDKYKDIVEKETIKHLNGVYKDIITAYNTEVDVFVIGGGSVKLRPYFELTDLKTLNIEFADAKEAQMENVDGLWEILVQLEGTPSGK